MNMNDVDRVSISKKAGHEQAIQRMLSQLSSFHRVVPGFEKLQSELCELGQVHGRLPVSQQNFIELPSEHKSHAAEISEEVKLCQAASDASLTDDDHEDSDSSSSDTSNEVGMPSLPSGTLNGKYICPSAPGPPSGPPSSAKLEEKSIGSPQDRFPMEGDENLSKIAL
jgi:hypothetical protein